MRSGWWRRWQLGSGCCAASTARILILAPERATSSVPTSATAMLIVDTGPLVAYLNRNDPDHERCASLLEERSDDLLVTPYVVTEACYLVSKYVGATAEINLVEVVAAGDLSQIEIITQDLDRMAQLMHKYIGFPLGVAECWAWSARDVTWLRLFRGEAALAGGFSGSCRRVSASRRVDRTIRRQPSFMRQSSFRNPETLHGKNENPPGARQTSRTRHHPAGSPRKSHTQVTTLGLPRPAGPGQAGP